MLIEYLNSQDMKKIPEVGVLVSESIRNKELRIERWWAMPGKKLG